MLYFGVTLDLPPSTTFTARFLELQFSKLSFVILRGGGGQRKWKPARQVMDGLWTEAHGQQKQSNDAGNRQHNLNASTAGRH